MAEVNDYPSHGQLCLEAELCVTTKMRSFLMMLCVSP